MRQVKNRVGKEFKKRFSDLFIAYIKYDKKIIQLI